MLFPCLSAEDVHGAMASMIEVRCISDDNSSSSRWSSATERARAGTVAVEHSTVNYKDGLAITGKAPIIPQSPTHPRHRLGR